jgi:hypothetical protein
MVSKRRTIKIATALALGVLIVLCIYSARDTGSAGQLTLRISGHTTDVPLVLPSVNKSALQPAAPSQSSRR